MSKPVTGSPDAAPFGLLNTIYFEVFGVKNSCPLINANQPPSCYSHVYFEIGRIPSDFGVYLSGFEELFETFSSLRDSKRILSFGGWSFSSSLGFYWVFQEDVTDANRLAFAQNVVAFVDRYNLDGVNFNWEYPGAPDVSKIPADGETNGPNYLAFLVTLRSLLPSDKSISMAIPASYWYLRASVATLLGRWPVQLGRSGIPDPDLVGIRVGIRNFNLVPLEPPGLGWDQGGDFPTRMTL